MAAASPPDGIVLARHRDRPRSRVVWFRRSAVVVLVVARGRALRSLQAGPTQGPAPLPRRCLRSPRRRASRRPVLPGPVHRRGPQRIGRDARPRRGLDGATQHQRREPAPTARACAGRLALDFGPLDPGREARRLPFSSRSTRRTSATLAGVELCDGDRLIASVDRTVTVFLDGHRPEPRSCSCSAYVLMRAIGRRELSQMQPFDLLLLVVSATSPREHSSPTCR